MFAFSDAFDDLFLQDVTFSSSENNKAREIQEIIQEQIVYRLRLWVLLFGIFLLYVAM